MEKLNWKRASDGLGHEAFLGDFKVSRVTCMSGKRHYYLHYITRYIKSGNCQWHMSYKMYSLSAIRGYLKSLTSECGIEILGEKTLKTELEKAGVK